MTHSKPYKTFQDFLAVHFDKKVQKISINAGFTCPNRDGSIGWGGCTYCNNQTFNPDYCVSNKSVTVQLEEGKKFFSKKNVITSRGPVYKGFTKHETPTNYKGTSQRFRLTEH